MATKATPTTFHERFGEVTRAQLAAYRKFNVSQSDHWDLVEAFGAGDHKGITEFVIKHSQESGMYSVFYAAGQKADDEDESER